MPNLDDVKLDSSKLILEGTPEQQEEWSKLIDKRLEALKPDQSDRAKMYRVRKNFYNGDQASYTTVVGRVIKEKKGHANAVYNYVGKTATKIGYGLANNPPKVTIPARSIVGLDFVAAERTRAQGVEDFVAEVFKRNRFWKRHYRRGCFNQVVMADAALKTWPFNKGTKEKPIWELKIVSHENIESLLVGWRADDPSEFDYVIAEIDTSIQSLKEQFDLDVPEVLADTPKAGGSNANSNWSGSNQWNTKSGGTSATLPTGKTNVPTVKLIEYDDQNVYALKLKTGSGSKLIQLAFKDGVSFPKVKFWVMVPNIPNPNSPWSISDIDCMVDPQIEFNETSNEERDYIRVGAKQRFVAYNMDEFDPESVKTESGGVIFVNSPMGDADFKALQTNVNIFPSQQFLQRTRDVLYDLGIPKVVYGSSGADSGRSKSIDYQSMIDLVIFKRDAWELALDQLIEKIQVMAHFYFKDSQDIFEDPETEEFVTRYAEFDWTDILPVTQADKVVNVLNKVQMGLPFRIAFKELGYRDVESVLQAMRKEAKDPDLMMFRSKMYGVSGGLLEAQQRAQSVVSSMEQPPPASTPGAPEVNQAAPTLVSSQNEGGNRRLPMATRGGTTSFSTGKGLIAKARQNLIAAGG